MFMSKARFVFLVSKTRQKIAFKFELFWINKSDTVEFQIQWLALL